MVDLKTSVQAYLHWSSEPQDIVEELELILATVEDQRFPGGIIPCIQKGVLVYYAVTDSSEQWRQLVAYLKSWIGSTATNFNGQRIKFDPQKPLEAILLDHGYQMGACFSAETDDVRGEYTRRALLRLSQLHKNSQILERQVPRTTGEVVRTFELALAAHQQHQAQRNLDFLRENMRLDALNLRFLQMRLLYTFEDWTGMRRHPFFDDLCQLRRPPNVTNAMAEALYRDYVDESEGPQKAVDVFKNHVLGEVGNLFNRCPPEPTPGAAKAFLIAALASTPSDHKLAQDLKLKSHEWPDHEVTFFEELFDSEFVTKEPESVKEPSWTDSPAAAIEVHVQDQSPPTVTTARNLLAALHQVDSLKYQKMVYDYVKSLNRKQREELFTNNMSKGAFDRLSESLELEESQFVPANWLEWITQLSKVPPGEKLNLHRRATDEWNVHDHLRTESDVEELSVAINTSSSDASAMIRSRLFDTIPFLVQWLCKDQSWPETYLKPLYKTIYENLIVLDLTERWSPEPFGAARQLLQGMLQLGLSEGKYKDAIDQISDVLPKEISSSNLYDLTELIELTLLFPSPDPDVRSGLWSQFIGSIGPMGHQLDRGQRSLINDLAHDFGMKKDILPIEKDVDDSQPDSNLLKAKTVAIYTLTESAGSRARKILIEHHPGVQVTLNSDPKGNSSLQSLARSADIFVICWQSASHPATEFIKKWRDSELPTLYVYGKGSSSILREIDQHLAEAPS